MIKSSTSVFLALLNSHPQSLDTTHCVSIVSLSIVLNAIKSDGILNPGHSAIYFHNAGKYHRFSLAAGTCARAYLVHSDIYVSFHIWLKEKDFDAMSESMTNLRGTTNPQ